MISSVRVMQIDRAWITCEKNHFLVAHSLARISLTVEAENQNLPQYNK